MAIPAIRCAWPALLALCCVVMPSGAVLADDADPVLAVINGHQLRESYVYQQIESLPLGEQVDIRQRLDHFVDSLVREETLFQAMLSSNFENEPELRETVKHSVVEALIERHVRARVNITDDDVREYYENNKPMIRGEYISASLIVVDDFAECEALRDSLTTDEAFAAASAQVTVLADVRERRGDVGLFMPHAGPWGFEDELFEMQAGEQRIFDIDGRCHLVRARERVTPPLPPIEKVAENITRLIRRDEEVRLLRELFEAAESKVVVERPQRQ